jgi:hypothetical protein
MYPPAHAKFKHFFGANLYSDREASFVALSLHSLQIIPSFYSHFYKMPFAIRLLTTLFLVNMAIAFPFMKRGIQWSFDLYPSTQCDGEVSNDIHSGMGSTGCRADLNTMASAYRLNTIAPGCQVEFFENTMCEKSETSGVIVDLSAGAESCQATTRRIGSYQVTCDEGRELRIKRSLE